MASSESEAEGAELDTSQFATEVEVWDIEDVHPYVNNPKQHPDEQVERIRSSIKNYGWDQPIVVDAEGEIIKGHGRREAALSLGLEQVPVIVRDDLTEGQKKAARIADNRSGESEWDVDTLAAELEALRDDTEFDLDLAAATAFDDSEVEAYFDALDGTTGSGTGDFTPGSLQQDFGVPPFSVLNTTRSYWTDRREQWKEMGLDTLQETPGREDAMVDGSANAGGIYTGSWDNGEKSGGIGGGIEGTGTSVFDPVLAELLYRWFSPEGATILDPFAGGPARAVVAAVTGRAYHGIDLNPEQVQHNRESWDNVVDGGLEVDHAPQWVEGDSSALDQHVQAFGTSEFDFLFSCPPYHNLEQYTEDDRDLSNMSYHEFLEVYRAIIQEGVNHLADNRFAAFVVSEVRDEQGHYRGLVSSTVEAFHDAGMHLYNDAVLVNTPGTLPVRVRNYFEDGRKLGRMHQNVLVFYKGDPTPAVIRENVGQVMVPTIVLGDEDAADGADSGTSDDGHEGPQDEPEADSAP